MKQLIIIALSLVALSTLQGCFGLSFGVTRTETDVYTITQRDTTIRQDVKNAPGDRDNGTIYPSPRTVEIERSYRQKDSTVNRYYPAFLRFGFIETAGFITTGSSDSLGGAGLFGLYKSLLLNSIDSSKIFGASMVRLVPFEIPLRAFQTTSKWTSDWTLGTAAYDQFTIHRGATDTVTRGTNAGKINVVAESLEGYLPLYVRKRFFLRDEPPYIMVVPFLGLGYLPAQYVNIGATIDVGSYGGFNLRGYAGYVTGTHLGGGALANNPGVSFPYFGLGVSALDFVNKDAELYTEWKDHKHSAIEVSGVNADMVYATAQRPDSLPPTLTASSAFPTGVMLRVASATFPLPFYNHHFFVGTSLLNVVWPALFEASFGFLPVRVGYRVNLLQNDLNLEPFAQFTYYPSTIYEAGVRGSLKIYDWAQLEVTAGYISAQPNFDRITSVSDFQDHGNFRTYYVGIGVGFGDFFHTVEQVTR